jgi:hypothetical protein
MRRRINKKGMVEEALEQLPYMLLTIAVIAGMYFLLKFYSTATVDPAPVQANVFLYRMVYSPNALSHTDKITGRVYPGLIFEEEFKTANLERAINYSYEKQIMAKFEIFDEAGQSKGVAYYNEQWYTRLEPLAKAGIAGSGSANYYEKELPVIYRIGVTDLPAVMKVSVIIPSG